MAIGKTFDHEICNYHRCQLGEKFFFTGSSKQGSKNQTQTNDQDMSFFLSTNFRESK